MNFERTMQLRRVLVEVSLKNKRFNLGMWHTNNSCGTTCCAIGWAARDAWHNHQGLGLALIADCGTYQVSVPTYTNAEGIEISGFAAVAEYLEISYDMAQDLFALNSYNSYADDNKKSEITVEVVIDKLDRAVRAEIKKCEQNQKPLPIELTFWPTENAETSTVSAETCTVE